MQTTLLGVAIAIILALVSALVAPLVVDWNRYRAGFESEASRLTGLSVRVNGAIDARILPIPSIKLRDVDVGVPGQQPQVHAGTVELEIGLGPLLRGQVRATQLRLLAPQINLGLDASGAVNWPTRAPAAGPEALTVSRFSIDGARVVLSDARSGARLVLQKFWFNGDIRSLAGPFHGEGAFVVGDELYGYRLSGGRVGEDGGIKIRLGVDPSNHPLTTEFEGTLRFDHGMPQFDGALALARPVGVTLADGKRVMSDPWRMAGKVRATPAAASFDDLVLQYGPDERAVGFNGKAQITFDGQPHIDGAISTMQLDVDRMLAAPDETHRLPFEMVKSFFEAFVTTVKPPLPTNVALAFDAVTVGGTTIQSLRGNVRFDNKQWRLSDFAFRAPGFTEINLSGQLVNGPHGLTFSGPSSLQSEDVETLMAWLEGHKERPSGPTKTLTARGDVAIGADRFALDRLAATLDREKVEGRLAYVWADKDHPARLDGELHAANLDVDALMAFAEAADSGDAFEAPREVALVLDVGKATLGGVEASKINGQVKFNSGVLHIDRLSVGDLGGAALAVSGHIDELSSQPRGQLTLDLNATTLAGLCDVVDKFAPQAAASFRLFADRLVPAKVHGVLTIDRATDGSIAKLDLSGDVGALRISLNGQAAGAPAHPEAAILHVGGRLEADDGGAVVRLLGLDRVIAVDQLPGQLVVSADGPLNGALHVNGLASAGGFSAALDGSLHLYGGDAPSGNLEVKTSSADFSPLRRAMTGQSGAGTPVSASAVVGIAGMHVTVTDLSVTVGKAPVHGRLDLKLASPVTVDGDIEADNVDAAAVAAMLLGLPSAAAGAKPWSTAPIGAGAFGALSGNLTFKLDHAALTPALVARDLKGVLQFQPPEIALRSISGSLANGRLVGALNFRRDSEKLIAEGRIELSGAHLATLLAADNDAIDGLLTVKAQGDSIGTSPDNLVGSLHGGATIALTNAQFAGVDPAAFGAAIRAADGGVAIDAPNVSAVVSAAMEKGRLTLAQGTAEATITGGQLRLTDARVPALGGARLTLDGVLDLKTIAIDGRATLSGPPPSNALIDTRPELTIRVKGPLAAPERNADVSALVGWLALRATEQQTRRLELAEAEQHGDALSRVVRPPSPPIRFIPQGTPLEIKIPADAAAPALHTRFDRLRPENPAGLPAPRPTAAASPVEAAPQPAAH